MKHLLFAALGLLIATAAQAQQVSECDWRSDARYLAEPWEQNTRTFANGNVRVSVLDTSEPAAKPIHFMVLSPPRDELGFRQCRIISAHDGGFGEHWFEDLTASYDPARGLVFVIPVAIWYVDTHSVVRGLEFTVNQATGRIDTKIRTE